MSDLFVVALQLVGAIMGTAIVLGVLWAVGWLK